MVPLRIAIIGFGKIAVDQHVPSIRGINRFKFVAAASPNTDPDEGDITAYKALEAQLRHHESRLEEAQRLAHWPLRRKSPPQPTASRLVKGFQGLLVSVLVDGGLTVGGQVALADAVLARLCGHAEVDHRRHQQ